MERVRIEYISSYTDHRVSFSWLRGYPLRCRPDQGVVSVVMWEDVFMCKMKLLNKQPTKGMPKLCEKTTFDSFRYIVCICVEAHTLTHSGEYRYQKWN